MPETEVLDLPAMSLTRRLHPLSKASRKNLKARPNGRRTRTIRTLLLSFLGSRLGSAVGIAITSLPDRRRCEPDGTGLPQCSRDMCLPRKVKIRESRSPQGEREHTECVDSSSAQTPRPDSLFSDSRR